jgi:hypothetical protein
MRLFALAWLVVSLPAAVGAAPPEPPNLFGIAVGPHMRLEVGDDTGRHDQWDQLDKVTIRLVKNSKTVWTKHGWNALTGTDDKSMPAGFRAPTCKLFDLHVFPQKLDKRDGVRLSLECKNHDMTHLGHEIVVASDILVDSADPYRVLYVGEGSGYDDGGSCDTVHGVSYALAGNKLTITTTDSRGKTCATPGTSTTSRTVTL